MAQLTEEEAAQLKALTEKSEAPDEPAAGEGSGISRVLNVTVDLGDEDQIERAIGLGFMSRPEAEGLEEGEGEGEGEGEEEPRRRGYFQDAK